MSKPLRIKWRRVETDLKRTGRVLLKSVLFKTKAKPTPSWGFSSPTFIQSYKIKVKSNWLILQLLSSPSSYYMFILKFEYNNGNIFIVISFIVAYCHQQLPFHDYPWCLNSCCYFICYHLLFQVFLLSIWIITLHFPSSQVCFIRFHAYILLNGLWNPMHLLQSYRKILWILFLCLLLKLGINFLDIVLPWLVRSYIVFPSCLISLVILVFVAIRIFQLSIL